MEHLKCSSKSSRTRTLRTGALLKIGQYSGDLSKTKRFRARAGNPSGFIPKCPGKSSRTKTPGTGTVFKIDTHYPGDSSETQAILPRRSASEQPQVIFWGLSPNIRADGLQMPERVIQNEGPGHKHFFPDKFGIHKQLVRIPEQRPCTLSRIRSEYSGSLPRTKTLSTGRHFVPVKSRLKRRRRTGDSGS